MVHCLQVVLSCSAFTALRELHLCSNSITDLASNVSKLLPESLEVLVSSAVLLIAWQELGLN